MKWNAINHGKNAEKVAEIYLKKQGLKKIAANYSCKLGEIDLIMFDGTYLVFVEVRARSSSIFGGAVASINQTKQKKIFKTASFFLMEKKLQDVYPLRFDVIGLDGNPPKISWLKNAFAPVE